MLSKSVEPKTEVIDYSLYEKLLQRISSIELQNIADLHSEDSLAFEESFSKQSESYYKQIEQLIQETSKEV